MTHAQRWRDELRTGVLIVHHSNAGGTRERGHSAMRGAADAMIPMTAVDDVIHVECSKLRNGAPFQPTTLKLVLLLRADASCGRPPTCCRPGTHDQPAQGARRVRQETFSSNGATKTEWKSACLDVPD